MSEQNNSSPKNLLKVVLDCNPPPELLEKLKLALEPQAAELNAEVIVCPAGVDIQLDSTARLAASIERLVEINQAMLEYIVSSVIPEEQAPVGSSLDG